MNTRSNLAVLFLTTLILLAWSDVISGRIEANKPFLFGRRGVNPNMNSLFFGKRSDIPNAYDEDEICSLCRVVQPTCNICVKENLLELAEEP